MARRSRKCNRKGTCGRALGRRKRRHVRATKVRHRPSPPSPGGVPLVLAVGRLSGRSSPGVCRWTPRGLRLPGLDATPTACRTDAVGSIGAPAPGGGGAGLRAHCTEARHGTVRTHPLQVCLASPDEAPIRSAYLMEEGFLKLAARR